jgi:hypothetical protein
MPRRGTRDLAKERYWRGIIQDWISSGKSGAEFCRLHGLKWYLLKEWRKNIQKRDADMATARQRVKSSRSTNPSPVSKTPKKMPSLAQFVPAVITDSHPAKTPASNESTIELILSCGMMLRITSACRPDFLSSIVTALENR